MNEYILMTDSACDLPPELLAEWGVRSIEMTFRFEGDGREYANSDMPINAFYARMRKGGVAKTAAINPQRFSAAFEEVLRQGKDVLYLGFTSGLSATLGAARLAAEELSERYPERRIVVVDTLTGSAGQGLLVCLTAQQMKSGATIDEAAAFAEAHKMSVCHWVTVDDLVYLKRGGRISPTVALVGKALGIKPLIHLDDDGKLVSAGKARGRSAALAALAERYGELAKDPANGPAFISHSDCLAEAEELAGMIGARFGGSVGLITDIGPVVGAHCGPGTVALFFPGKKR